LKCLARDQIYARSKLNSSLCFGLHGEWAARRQNGSAVRKGERRSPDSAAQNACGCDPEDFRETFNFDMITPDRLLERSVGQEIGVIIINPMSGEEATKPATVLSVMTGQHFRANERD
jgi:hypothetical protein